MWPVNEGDFLALVHYLFGNQQLGEGVNVAALLVDHDTQLAERADCLRRGRE